MDYEKMGNYDLIHEAVRLNKNMLKNLISMMVIMGVVFVESIVSFFVPVSFLVFIITMLICYGLYLVHYFSHKRNQKKYNSVRAEMDKRKLD